MSWTQKELQAMYFAIGAHEAIQQKRKYTNRPYYEHPLSVARLVKHHGGSEDMVCAALGHDLLEDVGSHLRPTLIDLFGHHVAILIDGLTDVSKPEDGSRATRKAIDRAHTAEQSPECKTIKLCDLIDNAGSILQHDKKFARVYIKEKEPLLEMLKEGDVRLWNVANDIVQKAKVELGIS